MHSYWGWMSKGLAVQRTYPAEPGVRPSSVGNRSVRPSTAPWALGFVGVWPAFTRQAQSGQQQYYCIPSHFIFLCFARLIFKSLCVKGACNKEAEGRRHPSLLTVSVCHQMCFQWSLMAWARVLSLSGSWVGGWLSTKEVDDGGKGEFGEGLVCSTQSPRADTRLGTQFFQSGGPTTMCQHAP